MGGWSREATAEVFGQQCLSPTPLQLHVQIEMQTKLTPVHVTAHHFGYCRVFCGGMGERVGGGNLEVPLRENGKNGNGSQHGE